MAYVWWVYGRQLKSDVLYSVANAQTASLRTICRLHFGTVWEGWEVQYIFISESGQLQIRESVLQHDKE